MTLENKEILIIGGTGSLGNALTDKLIPANPKGIRILSRDELKQWEQKKNQNRSDVGYLIGDIRDKSRLMMAMRGVDIVINCAAMKQVPACENDPIEAVNTNITGISNLIECSIYNDVQEVYQISTDKACYPINLYGATKLVGEKMIINANKYSPGGTKFNVFRYGNVIGSRGSIVPLLREQKKTGKITITHHDMTRFWITLREVSEFICNTIIYQNFTGSILIPKMKALAILDLVKVIAPECEIDFIGIRPGEKIHEILITIEESKNLIIYDNFYNIENREVNIGMKFILSSHNFEKMSQEEIEAKLNDL